MLPHYALFANRPKQRILPCRHFLFEEGGRGFIVKISWAVLIKSLVRAILEFSTTVEK